MSAVFGGNVGSYFFDKVPEITWSLLGWNLVLDVVAVILIVIGFVSVDE